MTDHYHATFDTIKEGQKVPRYNPGSTPAGQTKISNVFYKLRLPDRAKQRDASYYREIGQKLTESVRNGTYQYEGQGSKAGEMADPKKVREFHPVPFDHSHVVRSEQDNILAVHRHYASRFNEIMRITEPSPERMFVWSCEHAVTAAGIESAGEVIMAGTGNPPLGGLSTTTATATATAPASSGHGGASSGHGGTSSGHGGASSGHGGASSGHGGASSSHSSASSSHGGASSGHGGTSSGHGGTSSGHGGASSGHGGASSNPRSTTSRILRAGKESAPAAAERPPGPSASDSNAPDSYVHPQAAIILADLKRVIRDHEEKVANNRKRKNDTKNVHKPITIPWVEARIDTIYASILRSIHPSNVLSNASSEASSKASGKAPSKASGKAPSKAAVKAAARAAAKAESNAYKVFENIFDLLHACPNGFIRAIGGSEAKKWPYVSHWIETIKKWIKGELVIPGPKKDAKERAKATATANATATATATGSQDTPSLRKKVRMEPIDHRHQEPVKPDDLDPNYDLPSVVEHDGDSETVGEKFYRRTGVFVGAQILLYQILGYLIIWRMFGGEVYDSEAHIFVKVDGLDINKLTTAPELWREMLKGEFTIEVTLVEGEELKHVESIRIGFFHECRMRTPWDDVPAEDMQKMMAV